MANWCENAVTFTGEPSNIESITTLFKEIKDKQYRDELLYLPDFVTAERSYMIDILITGDEVFYCSRWLPNLEALQQMADHFNVGFVNLYNELNDGVLGEATYTGGKLLDIRLYLEDFQSCRHDPDSGKYVDDDLNHEQVWPIFLKLLEQRKANIYANSYAQRQGLGF